MLEARYFIAIYVPSKLVAKFLVNMKKWDDTFEVTAFYDKDVMQIQLQYAREAIE